MTTKDIINRHKLNKSTWTYKGFHGILHYFFVVGEMPLRPIYDYFGDSYRVTIYFFSHDVGHWYWRDTDMTRLRKMFLARFKKDPRILPDLLDEWHKRVKKFNSILSKIDNTRLKTLSNTKLCNLYKKFYQLYLDEYGIAIGIQDAFSMKSDEFLLPKFKKALPKEKFNQNYATLTSPVDESFITKEYKDRLKLIIKQKKGVSIKKDLKSHAKKYFWIQNNYAVARHLDENYFLSEIKKNKTKDAVEELIELASRIDHIKKEKATLIRKLKLKKELIDLIKITEVFAYIQDERKKYVLLASHYMDLFIEEIVRRTSYTRKQVEYSFVHETPEILEEKIPKKELEKRRQFCCVISTLKGYDIFSGKDAESLYKAQFERKKENLDTVKGTPASAGKARGRVKIITKIHDLIRFEKGDILIASMTRPEMVIAMEKAAAIVTDEGGVTSHAAVVSRELGVPCIIGTKKATKVFQENDLVEVDADKGTVKKIK